MKNLSKRLIAGAITLIVGAVGISVAFAQTNESKYKEVFTATLNGSSDAPPVQTNTTGEVAFGDAMNERSLDFVLNVYEGQNITKANLRCGTISQTGAVVLPLFQSDKGVNVDGTLASGTLYESDVIEHLHECDPGIRTMPHLIQAMREGKIHVDVYSASNPDGLIRGQLVKSTSTQNDLLDNFNNNGNDGGNNNGHDGSGDHRERVTINIAKHICAPDIQSKADFNSVDTNNDGKTTFIDKVVACPTVVLPDDNYSADALNYNQKLDFAFSTKTANDTMTMSDSSFKQSKLCETDLSSDGDGDGNTDDCIDVSYYSFSDVERGYVEVREVTPPTNTRPGALEFVPNSLQDNNDAETLISDELASAGVIKLSAEKDHDREIMLHVFNFQNENNGGGNGDTSDNNASISIMKHICGPEIQSQADFDRIGVGQNERESFLAKERACPVLVMPADAYTPNTRHHPDRKNFDFSFSSASGVFATLQNNGAFTQSSSCGNNANMKDDCHDTSYYTISNAPNGYVVVKETTAPNKTRPGALLFTPSSMMENNDSDTLLNNKLASNGTIELDMRKDSDDKVMLHVFNFRNVGDDNGNGDNDGGDNGNGGDNGSGDNQDMNHLLSELDRLFGEVSNTITQLFRLSSHTASN